MEGLKGKKIVVGGEGRFYKREVIKKIIKIEEEKGFGSIMVGKGGII